VSIWHRISHWLGLNSECYCTDKFQNGYWDHINCNTCGLEYDWHKSLSISDYRFPFGKSDKHKLTPYR
jgi:hypothetical protein